MDLCGVLSTLVEKTPDIAAARERVACAIVIAAADSAAIEEFVSLVVRALDAAPVRLQASEGVLAELRRGWARRPPNWRRDFIRFIRDDRHKIRASFPHAAGGGPG